MRPKVPVGHSRHRRAIGGIDDVGDALCKALLSGIASKARGTWACRRAIGDISDVSDVSDINILGDIFDIVDILDACAITTLADGIESQLDLPRPLLGSGNAVSPAQTP